uniref:AtpZ/AtpI family protein n=1 Tax=candidate division CPR3 bacterium TaxID=2268181 RepID=A0A7C4M0G5_UNCC3
MSEKKKDNDNWTAYIQLGLELSSYVAAFFFAGYFLDVYFKTRPYFTVSGASLGVFSVFYILWKKFLR